MNIVFCCSLVHLVHRTSVFQENVVDLNKGKYLTLIVFGGVDNGKKCDRVACLDVESS